MKLKHQKYFQATRNYNNKTVDIHPAAGDAMVGFRRSIPHSGLHKKNFVTRVPHCCELYIKFSIAIPKLRGIQEKKKHCVAVCTL